MEMKEIVRTVADYYSMENKLMYDRWRFHRNAFVRHVAMYFCRKHGYGFLRIARHFKRKNHTSVIYAVKKVNFLLKADSEIARDVYKINQILRSKK